jgi:type IV secretion system protein VirB10
MSADEFEPLRRDNLSAFQAAPQVGVTSSPWTLVMGICAAAALGLWVFASLSAGRQEGAGVAPPPRQTEVVQAPPAYVVPTPDYEADLGPEPDYEAQSPDVDVLPMAAPPADPMSPDARLHSPALVIDLSEPEANRSGGPGAQAIAAAVGGQGLSGNESFAARFGAGQAALARPLANPGMTISQGVIIDGVLETAINSDLPGYVRALVSRDVSSFDGRTVLVPRGSRLIGQYRASSELGQSRAFVIWTRLIRPDGVSVDINSPGADSLGRGGLEGKTDRHFFRRFGGAILLTLIGGAANAVGDDTDTQVVVGVARGGGDAASAALSQEINIPPTISVRQGTPVRIFVARDLDFSSVSGRAQ